MQSVSQNPNRPDDEEPDVTMTDADETEGDVDPDADELGIGSEK
jgi:hypothetical protein